MVVGKGELLFFRNVAMKDTRAPAGGPPCTHTLGALSGLLRLRQYKVEREPWREGWGRKWSGGALGFGLDQNTVYAGTQFSLTVKKQNVL